MFCITKRQGLYEIIDQPDYQSWASTYPTIKLADAAIKILKGITIDVKNAGSIDFNKHNSDSTYERWKATNKSNKDNTNKKTTRSYGLKKGK